jgi:mRNA interferase MazF
MGRTEILKNKIYVPDAGDLVWADFDPAIGREQKGLRPALVLSGRKINNNSGCFIACPITSVIKNYSLNTDINSKKIKGQILINQIKTLDWENRTVVFIEKASEDVMSDVKAKIAVILEL